MTIIKFYKKWLHVPAISVEQLLSITAFCWLAAKLIGWKVWVTQRSFPIIAPFSFLDNTPPVAHWILFGLSVILLLLLTVKPANGFAQTALFLTETGSCLLDENRWQPWEYLYLFILLLYIVNRSNAKVVMACLAITLSVVYLYSGLHKFNEGFLSNTWQDMILKRFLKIPSIFYHAAWLRYCGYLLPLGESLAGLCLLFSKTSKIAAIFLVVMHILLLLVIGPFGIHYNKVVWPWNVAMPLLLYGLFLQNPKLPVVQWIALGIRNKIVLSAWALLPALNFIGLWDNYLSWNLYSSTLPSLSICIKDTTATPLLKTYFIKNHGNRRCNGAALLNLQRWAMMEMNVPPYPEERVYKKIASQWNIKYPLAKADFVIFYFFLKK